jgi:flagellar motility protein MotE (MotC chaperone)
MRLKICMLMMFAALGSAPVCHAQGENDNTSVDKIKKETQEFIQTIGSYTADKREKAIQETKERLDKFDKRIDALEARLDKNWNKMSDAARKETRENLKALRKQRNRVAEWYGSMKTSSGDAWDDVKSNFTDAYQDLERIWQDSAKETSATE